MRKIFLLLLIFGFVFESGAQEAIIIDHSCCDISQVPDSWVLQAKDQFKISYGHTSHGSQIVTGMQRTVARYGDLYSYNSGEGSLDIRDRYPSGDLGNPNRTEWANKTRMMLNEPDCDRNMVMWSWCGQVDGSSDDIGNYLTLMDELENDFPDIIFVYMTGHLNGTGEDGNVHQRNNQIRDFCRENGKILFDFADIESYDPDGNYFRDKNANDGCYYYDENQNRRNWAEEWCDANPGECDDCGCAHSHCLNCQQKGKAFWWMMARIAGWDGEPAGVENELSGGLELSLSPSIFSGSATIGIELPEACVAEVKIFNQIGEDVGSINAGYLEAGRHELEASAEGLPQGWYIFALSTKYGKVFKKALVIR